jgi:hypothetical protein
VTTIRVCIPTRNRPHLLRRAIESLERDIRLAGIRCLLLVVDQSDPAIQNTNRSYLGKLSSEWFPNVWHLGNRERKVIYSVSALYEPMQLTTEDARAAQELCYGENRNWPCLFFAGRPFISFDDDVVLRSARPKVTNRENRLGVAGGAPCALLAFDSEQDLHAAVEWIDSSAVDTLHKALCSTEPESQPQFVSCGVVGHSGLGTHALLAEVGCGVAREHLFASDRSFHRALRSTWVVRQSLSKTVTTMHGFMGTVFGTRNDRALVPFMPFGRGEDKIYATTIRHLRMHDTRLELPHSVLHLPDHGRIPHCEVDVISSSSLTLAFIIGIAPTDLLSFVRAARERLQSPEWQDIFIEMLGSYAQLQKTYCESVGSQPDLCRAAYRSVARTMLAWRALANACASRRIGGDVVIGLMQSRDTILQWCSIAEVWNDLWAEANFDKHGLSELCSARS